VDLSVTRAGEPPDRDLAAVEKRLTAAARTAARDVGAAARKQILDDVKTARGSLRFAGGRLGVKATVDANPAGAAVTLRATPAGAWAILEDGTRRYTIRPNRRRVLASRAVAGRAGVFGRQVIRPARPGRQVWTRAVDRLGDRLDADVAAPFDQAIAEG
jgi:hypothetical protein